MYTYWKNKYGCVPPACWPYGGECGSASTAGGGLDSPSPPWKEWQTGVKTLPCSKLRLRAVISDVRLTSRPLQFASANNHDNFLAHWISHHKVTTSCRLGKISIAWSKNKWYSCGDQHMSSRQSKGYRPYVLPPRTPSNPTCKGQIGTDRNVSSWCGVCRLMKSRTASMTCKRESESVNKVCSVSTNS